MSVWYCYRFPLVLFQLQSRNTEALHRHNTHDDHTEPRRLSVLLSTPPSLLSIPPGIHTEDVLKRPKNDEKVI